MSFLLPSPQDPDKNKRLLIHAAVQDNSGVIYNVVVLHLSYHRQQQCKNMAEILTFIKRKSSQNQTIVDWDYYTSSLVYTNLI